MSKTVLFYFTGTGNSLAVARVLAENLEDIILIPMLSDDAPDYIDEYTEKIGLIFPIHINAVPHVVVKFIEKMQVPSSMYFFAVATHGGVPGMSGLYLNKILKKQRISLDGYFEIRMVNNTPKGVAPKLLMKLNWETDITPEKTALMLQESQEVIGNVVKKIKDMEKTTLQQVPSGRKKIGYWMMNLMWYINGKSKHKLNFILDESYCSGCGTCAKVCTTNRIKMHNNKPEWIHDNCSFCYACFNYCPNQAIGVEHYTKRLGRYHHPEISEDDIARQTQKSSPNI